MVLLLNSIEWATVAVIFLIEIIASSFLQVARNSNPSECHVGLITSYFSNNIISKQKSFFKLFKLKKKIKLLMRRVNVML